MKKIKEKKNIKIRIILLLLIALVAGFIFLNKPSTEEAKKSNFIEFTSFAQSGTMENISLEMNGSSARITWEIGDEKYFMNESAYIMSNKIANIITDNKLEVDVVNKDSGRVFSIITTVLSIIMIVAVISLITGKGKFGSIGKLRKSSSNEIVIPDKITFDDVAGIDEVRDELQEIIEFLKTPDKFTKFGAKIPKGVLLSGEPGTGKTLVAKAVAGEAGVPFYSISGSEFVEMFVGVGASRVRELFENAGKTAPCIIFIDEIDAVGRHRGSGMGGGNDEREQTLNQLLVEMDGMSDNKGIVIIAATNRIDVLDKALLRAGRFDRQIVVSAPDVKGRELILRLHSRNKPLADDVDLSLIAKRTSGSTGANLANIMNEAALLAVRNNETKISKQSVEQAVERELIGPEKRSRVMSDKEKKLVAYHEAGHAVAAYYLDTLDPVHKISIIPRGVAGGYTLTLGEEEKRYMTKRDMMHYVSLLLGGRVAEEIEIGDVSTGASNDIERATEILRKMVTVFGMSSKVSLINYDYRKDANYSEETKLKIEKTIIDLMDDCYKETKRILTKHRDKLDLVSEKLMELEVLSKEEFEELMK